MGYAWAMRRNIYAGEGCAKRPSRNRTAAFDNAPEPIVAPPAPLAYCVRKHVYCSGGDARQCACRPARRKPRARTSPPARHRGRRCVNPSSCTTREHFVYSNEPATLLQARRPLASARLPAHGAPRARTSTPPSPLERPPLLPPQHFELTEAGKLGGVGTDHLYSLCALWRCSTLYLLDSDPVVQRIHRMYVDALKSSTTPEGFLKRAALVELRRRSWCRAAPCLAHRAPSRSCATQVAHLAASPKTPRMFRTYLRRAGNHLRYAGHLPFLGSTNGGYAHVAALARGGHVISRPCRLWTTPCMLPEPIDGLYLSNSEQYIPINMRRSNLSHNFPGARHEPSPSPHLGRRPRPARGAHVHCASPAPARQATSSRRARASTARCRATS
jgi:hypothetical protein